MKQEALLQPNEDGTFTIRVTHNGWGTVGPRLLKGENELPPYKNLTRGNAVKACQTFQDFLDNQHMKRSKTSMSKLMRKKRRGTIGG
jgi:hypothetical protein